MRGKVVSELSCRRSHLNRVQWWRHKALKSPAVIRGDYSNKTASIIWLRLRISLSPLILTTFSEYFKFFSDISHQKYWIN
ncbi:unnamed protein product [Blepharisma stoltei]|uniref:Uncharacterized protein n=1 Tax=Blepharisma stoltei TaxID=1481888 RepID=A0AAU9J7X5_9CILI|nr:unnamed protein product [Blepharisma stoltei]